MAAPGVSMPTKEEPIDSDAPQSSRAGGYRPSKDVLEMMDPIPESSKCLCPLAICAAIDFTLGPRMSVRKLVDQLRDDILICAAIFVANEALTAAFCVYWRPIAWSIFWILLTILISVLGLLANWERHTFGLIVFIVLQIMFSVINLQHLNMMHAEAVRECSVPQAHFRNCDVPALKHCIAKDACLSDEMQKLSPPCKAPGKAVCANFAHMDMVFWGNQLINFLTYAEPAFWAMMLLIRAEIVSQAEGKNNSTFRKMLKGKDLPEETEKQPYVWTGTIMISVCMLVVVTFTIYSEVRSGVSHNQL